MDEGGPSAARRPLDFAASPTRCSESVTDDETFVFGSDAAGLAELEYWKAASASGDPAELHAFLARYPSGRFADLARLRLLRLDAAAEPPAPPAQAPAAGHDASGAVPVVVVTLDATGAVVDRRSLDVPVIGLPLGAGLRIDLVAVPGGAFEMGATNAEALAARRELQHAAAATALRWIREEQPRRTVTVSPFRIGRTPVTQAQWAAGAALPRVRVDLDPAPAQFPDPDRPVERVSWYDATEFCDRLSLALGRVVRLPSEAEWEFACRAGSVSPFATGETLTPDVATYLCTEKFASGPRAPAPDATSPVGVTGIANAFGLAEVHGNVWEWCRDWHARDTYTTGAVVDPWGACSGTARVRRGGSWRTPPVFCRSAARFSAPPAYRHADTGFRIVAEDG